MTKAKPQPHVDFQPCDPRCPAVTGKPYGSVRYCPMQEAERHHSPGASDEESPDYTDCCANFQCCMDQIVGSGLEHVFASLAQGKPVVTDIPLWNTPPPDEDS